MNEQQEHLLNEYLDGTLSAAERREVEQLLAQSEAARLYLADLQTLFADLEAVEPRPVPHDFSAQVLAEVAAPAPRWLNGWLLAQLVLTVGLLLVAWPSLVAWLSPLMAVGSLISVATATLGQFAQQVAVWLTAVPTTITLPAPQFNLNSQQLVWLMGTAFGLWLLSNLWFIRQPAPLSMESEQ